MPSGLDIAAAFETVAKRDGSMVRAVCKTALMTTIIMTMRPYGPGPARAS